MNPLPESFIRSLEGIKGFDRESFLKVHASQDQVTSIRINPLKWKVSEEGDAKKDPSVIHLPSSSFSEVKWSRYGYYLKSRPSFTFDPVFHAGCYYVQEASSMFLEQAMRQLADLSSDLRILDLCGAPGGKSTHLQSLISENSLLVSNEVIRARSNILIDNMIKWGSSNVFVTNNDPSAFQKFPEYFDVMVVDAPCSGSGLFRRDPEAINEWSLNNVALCSQRQRRILADALPALKQGGLLIYSTCSYSREEDEEIADWLVNEFGMQNEGLKTDPQWGIVETVSKAGAKGYRFFPDKVKGEGFFLCCFRKMATEDTGRLKFTKPEKASAREKSILQSWVNKNDLEFIRDEASFWAVPSVFFQDLVTLSSSLKMIYKGIRMGSIMKEKLVPEHALALSCIISPEVPVYDLGYEDAVLYLQRREFSLVPSRTGWQIVRYQGHNLGWINALPNRINNYYPKELRILKQQNDTLF